MADTIRIFNGRDDPKPNGDRSPVNIGLYQALERLLFSLSESTVIVYAVLLLSAIALLDHLTGYEIAFSVFYVAPVTLAAWRAKRSIVLLICLLSSTVWGMVDYTSGHEYSNNLILLWNSIVRLFFFVIIALLLANLREKMRMLDRLARTDPLTGALNGRAFLELAGREIEQARRYGGSFTLLFIDLDNFKRVNDTCGHAAGDDLIRAVVESLRGSLRATDIIGRIGGDEFAVWLSHSAGGEARETVQRLQRAVAEAVSRVGCPTTMSIGAVSVPRIRPDLTPDILLKKADELMYRVKNDSKNGLLMESFED
ncbi:MAG TPA: GGDEF domain-containing protein [bacterium]|nr:GGDEF domain-containing protein [bacterium]